MRLRLQAILSTTFIFTLGQVLSCDLFKFQVMATFDSSVLPAMLLAPHKRKLSAQSLSSLDRVFSISSIFPLAEVSDYHIALSPAPAHGCRCRARRGLLRRAAAAAPHLIHGLLPTLIALAGLLLSLSTPLPPRLPRCSSPSRRHPHPRISLSLSLSLSLSHLRRCSAGGPRQEKLRLGSELRCRHGHLHNRMTDVEVDPGRF